jgi:hypothetical protein
MIFFAKPKYCGAFARRAKATAGHFITCKWLTSSVKVANIYTGFGIQAETQDTWIIQSGLINYC